MIIMSFDSDIEYLDVELIGFCVYMCEIEFDEDYDEEVYFLDLEGFYMDEFIVDDEWLVEYN